jgi:hypothetical protein
MFGFDKYHPMICSFRVIMQWIARMSSIQLESTDQIVGSFESGLNAMAKQ